MEERYCLLLLVWYYLPNGEPRHRTLYISRSSSPDDGFLSGTISPLLVKLDHLETLSFANLKKISGPFPQFIFQLPRLKHVILRNNPLEGNRLTGPIPSSISNLTRLTWLNLRENRLSGAIPDVFKSMTELQHLDLSHNKFSGKLPPSMASLAPTLALLYMSHNALSGTIPSYFSRFKELSNLDLTKNRFSGAVPMGFTNLTNILNLQLSHNLLTGPLPALSPGIVDLDLSYNKFHMKTIPKWVTLSTPMSGLKLAKCGIKMNIGDWKPVRIESLSYIDLSENEISGNPSRFLNQAVSLQVLIASRNKLRFNLEKLNFTDSLKTLDLSRNLVYGKVPASVAGLDVINLSQNHLCGKLPVTTFPASVFVGNDCLCGSPLSPCKT